MEEKNQDTQDTNQYTGEYGNPMEKSEDTVKPAGEEQSSSVYSYSYRDHKPEATSSGDYHASENASSAGAAQSAAGETAQSQETSGDANAETSEKDRDGWTSMGNQQMRND